MSLSMYQASVPLFIHSLTSLSAFLKKGEAHAKAHKIDPEVLANARLYPDMFTLVHQVQIACDNAKGCPARLAGQQPPSHPDTEKTFADMYARIDKTIAYLKTFKPEQIDGSEDRAIELKMRDHTEHTKGQTYLIDRVIPNFFFHVTTAYNILRHNGVEIGKRDYLGG